MAILPTCVFSENYVLNVGDVQTLFVPEAPIGFVDKTVWACDEPNVVFLNKDNVSADIKITSYFDKAAIVSLIYVCKYVDDKGWTRKWTGTKYFTIQCNMGLAPTILPKNGTLKVGESLKLHVSPSSYESDVSWSLWSPLTASLTTDGIITAKKEGVNFVFAKIPGLSNPLTYTVNIVNPKLTLKSNINSETIEKGEEIVLSASKENATIYYTLDGSSPIMNGDKYVEPIKINSKVTLRAIAFDNDEEKEPSEILTKEFNVIETNASELDNVIFINDYKAFAGDEVDLSIKLKNIVPVRGFQFTLYLPDGVAVVKNTNGRIQATLSCERLPESDSHILAVSEQKDGGIFFICDSQYGEGFKVGNGEVITIKLKVEDNQQRTEQPIYLKNIKLDEGALGKSHEIPVFKSIFEIFVYIQGDVNGDQQVTIRDYIDIANHIHGNSPIGFIDKVADVNNDNIIDVSDYIGIANIINMGSIYGDELHATISTNNATNIEDKIATLNGTLSVVSATKDYTVGFFISSNGTPSNENYINKLEVGKNIKGTFSYTISNLSYSTTYYYCSYILYKGVYYYGEQKSFSTTKKTTFAIGDLYPDNSNPIGIVFYTYNKGKSGLIAALDRESVTWPQAKQKIKSNTDGWALASKSNLLKIADNYSYLDDYIKRGFYWSSDYRYGLYDMVWIVVIGEADGSTNGSTYEITGSKTAENYVLLVKSF